MADDITTTSLGQGCRCLPHSRTGGRGPGRVADPCPQVTAEALRTFGRLDPVDRPPGLAEVVRTMLRVWRERGQVKPYMFGHGMHFKAVKWPNIWYSDLTVLQALAPYPEVWSGASAERDDEAAAAELVACLAAYNTDPAAASFPARSTGASASTRSARRSGPHRSLRRGCVRPCAPSTRSARRPQSVDVTALGSAKGGAGVAVPPR